MKRINDGCYFISQEELTDWYSKQAGKRYGESPNIATTCYQFVEELLPKGACVAMQLEWEFESGKKKDNEGKPLEDWYNEGLVWICGKVGIAVPKARSSQGDVLFATTPNLRRAHYVVANAFHASGGMIGGAAFDDAVYSDPFDWQQENAPIDMD